MSTKNIVGVILLLGILFIALWAVSARAPDSIKKTQKEQVSETQRETGDTAGNIAISGLHIAMQTAIFLRKATNKNGSVVQAYDCEKGSNVCKKTDLGFSTANAYIAKAYYELFQKTQDTFYKSQADKVADFVLAACSKNTRDCILNVHPLYHLYRHTNDLTYKAAILSVADVIYDNFPASGYTISWENNGNRLEILYELTGDKKYIDRLEAIAKDLLANGYSADDNKIFYREGDLTVRTYSVQIAWDNYLPAYRVTKNPLYLQAAKDFFRKANITAHFADFASNGNTQDLNFISALLDLRDVLDDPKEKEEFGNYAHKLAQWSYSQLSDNPSNQKANGDYGFLFGATIARKITVQSAWRMSHYLRMADETFTIR